MSVLPSLFLFSPPLLFSLYLSLSFSVSCTYACNLSSSFIESLFFSTSRKPSLSLSSEDIILLRTEHKVKFARHSPVNYTLNYTALYYALEWEKRQREREREKRQKLKKREENGERERKRERIYWEWDGKATVLDRSRELAGPQQKHCILRNLLSGCQIEPNLLIWKLWRSFDCSSGAIYMRRYFDHSSARSPHSQYNLVIITEQGLPTVPRVGCWFLVTFSKYHQTYTHALSFYKFVGLFVIYICLRPFV